MSGDAARPGATAPIRPAWQRERLSGSDVALFVVTYLVIAELTVQLAGTAQVLPWFPPVGLSLAAAIIFGWRAAPLILLADTLQLMVRDSGGGWLESLAQGTTQAIIWTGVGLLIRGQLAGGPPLSRLRDASWLVIAGVFGGSALTTVTGLAVLDAIGQAQWTLDTAATYFVGDAIGIVAVTPTLLVLQAARSRPREAWAATSEDLLRGSEGLAMLAATLAVPLVLVPLAGGDLLALMPAPMAWIALRRGIAPAALATTLWTTSAILTYRLAGTEVSLMEISSTLAAGGLFALLAGAVVAERERGRARLAYLALWDGSDGTDPADLSATVERLLAGSDRADVAALLVRIDVPGVDGHAAHMDSEVVLRQATKGILRATTPDATIARVGHGEFMVLVEGPDAGRTGGIADALLAELCRPVRVRAREYLLEPSIGILRAPAARGLMSIAGAEGVLSAAHRAAKPGQRTHAVDDDLLTAIERDRDLADDLEYALSHDHLYLAYQPIVALRDQQPLAAEALVRWTHPERGPIGPHEFIPLAERCGLILPLGRWVLREACRSAMRWPVDGRAPIVLHVNVSPVQLHDDTLADFVAEVLEETGLAPRLLCLELTESALFEDLNIAAKRVEQLSALGVRVALDDFGTGASSLSWLQRLPVSALKVDRSFVDGLEAKSIDWAIVSATLGLADAIHVGTVAEGVEREAQLPLLQELGCMAIQGYLISKPVPEAEFVDWLGKSQRESARFERATGTAGPIDNLVKMPSRPDRRGHQR